MTGTRSFLQLKVGKTHTVDVLLHIRRQDIAWYNSPSADIRHELLSLLSKRIIPREFGDYIEQYHERRNPQFQKKVEVGEKNKPKSKGAGAKRKRGKAKKDQEPPPEKPRRDVTHVSNDKLRITYRLEEIKPYESATLTISGDSFRQLPKLRKRIVLWCYPPSDNDSTESDPEDGGFPRPELIPITSLFRQPEQDAAET